MKVHPQTMSPCFIDFEAFQHGGEQFKIKELCIVDADRFCQPMYMVFHPHTRWHRLNLQQRRTYAYQTNRLHHLHWNEGFMRYCRKCVFAMIQWFLPNWRRQTFYVLGNQKLIHLQREFPRLRLVEYNATLSQLPQLCPQSTCVNRNHGEHCAYLKCYRLYYHYMMLL